MRIEISRSLLDRIVAQAAADRGEICGILFGEEASITGAVPAANVAANRTRHFEIDPATLIAAHRAARSGGPRIVGHYHSHPGGAATPSATDAASAQPDGNWWLIVAGRDARLWIARAAPEGGVAFTEAQLVVG